MTSVTQPLRDEHRELRPDIDALESLADAVGSVPAGDIVRRLDATLTFLTDHLLVHAQAEEQVLYPAVAQVLGAPATTTTMSRDHVAIREMTTELQALRRRLNPAHLTPNDERSLRQILYGLHTLVRVHLAKEEDVFLPALDAALTADQARDLFTAMEHAAQALRVPTGLA